MADSNSKTGEGRLPPQNIEAEKSLLGSLMIDPDAIFKVVDFLLTKDFYKDTHQKIYQVITELSEKREPIDFLSVSSRLKEKKELEKIGGASYLTTLVNFVPTASHIANYAKIVQQKRILRDLISASYEIGEMGHRESEDADILLDDAEKKIFSIAQKSLSQRFVPIKEILGETFDRIDELSKHKGTLRGIPTGFKKLDNVLAGLQKSDLIVLAARPSLGKSALAVDIAKYVACEKKIPVGIFSLEMSKDQVIDRLVAVQANIDLWKLRTGRLSDQGEDNDFERIQRAMATLSESPIYIDDTAGSNVLQMRAMARRLQADQGLGLLIIDYLQLMESRNPNTTMIQQVTENSRALKGLARELNIPVLVLSQLNRAVEQRVPQIPRLSDLRESGCLTGDTLITRADTGERISIKNLVGKTNIPVHSLNEKWQMEEKKISKVFSSGRKMTYELTTKSGLKIKASANHPFRKIDGWKRLDQLQIGDLIVTPKKLKISSPKNELSKNEIVLLAHLLGDGCVLPRQPIHYTSGDEKNIKIVAKVAKKLFKIKPRIVKQENWWHVYLPSPYHLTHNKHNPIINWYQEIGIKPVRSWKKELPEKIFTLDENHLSLFLKHLWATDGNISSKLLKNRKPSASIYYATTSKKLAEGVKHLLLRLGIRSKISGIKKDDYRICYHINVQGNKHQLSFLRLIGCFGKRGEIIPRLIKDLEDIIPNTNLDIWPKESWEFIINPIREEEGISWRGFSAGIETSYCGTTLFKHGIGTERLAKIANLLQSQTLNEIAKSNIFWDQIVSIKKLKLEEVYDATVPNSHNFLANNIIVHNSIEQDADVVLFIHREDKYKPNSERKNIADILIAKHRNGPIGKVELYFDEPRVSFKEIEKGYEE